MVAFSKQRRRSNCSRHLVIVRVSAYMAWLKELELSDFHQIVQYIGKILPVDVNTF